MSYSTQQEINKNINNIKIIRDKVSHLFMPIRYFKSLNILPRSLVDEEIINKNFNEKWLHKTYFETNSNTHIKNTYYAIYEDYITHYRLKLNEALEQTNFTINPRVHIHVSREYFEDEFDMHVKDINFDLSPYYMKYFTDRVYESITVYTNKINKLTNGLTIEDLKELAEIKYVVFKNNTNIEFNRALLKVCPKRIKWNYINSNGNYIEKKNEFINDMPNRDFAILSDEGEYIIINKNNINDYI